MNTREEREAREARNMLEREIERTLRKRLDKFAEQTGLHIRRASVFMTQERDGKHTAEAVVRVEELD